MSRILAVATTALGDTLLASPALEALSQANEVDVLVHPMRLPLLQKHPRLCRLIPYRPNPWYRLLVAARLAGTRYDTLVVLHANDGLMKLLPWLRYDRARNVQGWNRPKLHLEDMNLRSVRHVAQRKLAMLERLGIPSVGLEPRVHLTPDELAQGKAWLEGRGLAGKTAVGLCVGGSHPYKLWPAECFGGLARALDRDGAGLVVVGSSGEEPLAREAEDAGGVPLQRAMGLPLRRCAAILAGLDLLVTNDTGPMHLAQAVGTPVLGLFGPTDPYNVGPLTPPHRWLQAAPDHEPCLAKDCTRPTCMANLSLDEVLATVREMLAEVRETRP